MTLPWHYKQLKHRGLLILLGIATFFSLGIAPPQIQGDADSASPSIEIFSGHAEYVYTISFSDDGNTMVTAAGDNTAIIWDLANKKPRHVLEHGATVYAAVASPDGTRIATADGDGNVAIWNLDGEKLWQRDKHADAVYCLAFSPTGKWLATGGGSTQGGDTTVRLWETEGLKFEKSFAGHQRQVYGLAFSPDGTRLASGSSDRTIRDWDLTGGEFRELINHSSDVYRIVYHADGRELASVSQDGSLRNWKLSPSVSETLFEAPRKTPIYGVVFSEDEKWLGTVGDDGWLRVWEADNRELVIQQKISSKALYAIAFSPDQQHVMVAGEDGDVYQVSLPSETIPSSK